MFDNSTVLMFSPIFWATLLAGLAILHHLPRAYGGSSYRSIRVETDDKQGRPRQRHDEEEHVLPSPEVIAVVTAMVVFVMLAAAGLIR